MKRTEIDTLKSKYDEMIRDRDYYRENYFRIANSKSEENNPLVEKLSKQEIEIENLKERLYKEKQKKSVSRIPQIINREQEELKINCERYKEQVVILNNKVQELNFEIENLKLEKSHITRNFESLGYKGYEYLHIVTNEKNDNRTYRGFVSNESTNHLKIWIYNTKQSFFYSYIIRKEHIEGIKEYNYDTSLLELLKTMLEYRKNSNKQIRQIVETFL